MIVHRNFFCEMASLICRNILVIPWSMASDCGGFYMQQHHRFRGFAPSVALAGAMLLTAHVGFSQQQKVVPDAQIEANVLKALAGAPELANQNITTTTVYGTVTLSGVVQDESLRVKAETLASRADGVKKVIDELTLGTPMPPQGDNSAQVGTNPNLQSDGSMAPGPGQPNQAPPPPNQTTGVSNPQDDGGPAGMPPPPNATQQRQPYSQPPSYSQAQPYAPPPGYNQAPPPYGAQPAGEAVVVPNGTMLRIRINQGLDSSHAQPGNVFDATVINDVAAGGAIAIPRGATVHGMVVEAKSAGALKGRGEIQLQLTQVVLAGKTFPLTSDIWSSTGPDKTARTVNSTLGLSALGAIIGGVAGGGAGAAIGAGVGGATGLAASAASGGGQALVPPEAIITFHLTQPAPVTTVSQAEMDRLGYGVPAGGQPRVYRRYPPPPPPYSGPVYYPSPY
jgi:BON domain